MTETRLSSPSAESRRALPHPCIMGAITLTSSPEVAERSWDSGSGRCLSKCRKLKDRTQTSLVIVVSLLNNQSLICATKQLAGDAGPRKASHATPLCGLNFHHQPTFFKIRSESRLLAKASLFHCCRECITLRSPVERKVQTYYYLQSCLGSLINVNHKAQGYSREQKSALILLIWSLPPGYHQISSRREGSTECLGSPMVPRSALEAWSAHSWVNPSVICATLEKREGGRQEATSSPTFPLKK